MTGLPVPHKRRPCRLAALLALCLSAAVAPVARAHAPLPEDIARLTRQIQARPRSAALYLERGELWRLNGRAASARADFRRAEALDPRLERLPLCRAALDLDLGAPAAALPPVTDFLRRHPADLEALRLSARIQEARGDWPAVAAECARIVRDTASPRPEDVLKWAEALRSGGVDPSPVALAAGLAALTEGLERLGSLVVLENAAADLEVRLGRSEAAGARWERIAEQLRDVSGGVGAVASGPIPPRPTATGATDAALSEAASTAASPASTQATTALPRLSTWKYHAQGVNLGTAWQQPGYADGAWPGGPAALGFGDPFIVTTIPYGPDLNNKYPTSYFRATFPVAVAPATIASLTLNVNYDDGFAAYLNGQEIARRGLAAGAGYAAYAANHEGGAYETIDVSAFVGVLVAGTNVLAVEVHQTNASSSDLAFDAELIYDVAAATGVTRGPYLQIGTPTSVTVRWRTAVPTDSRVRFGAAPGALTGAFDVATPTTEHEVTLTGLTPETRYYYSVGSATTVQAGDDAGHYFKTSPPVGAPRPTRFWILGDSGLPGSIQNNVRDAWETWAGGAAADVWLMLGDNAYDAGTDSEFTAGLFTPYAAQLRKTILWPTRGNHDVVYSGAGNDYYDHFSLPTAGQAGGLPSGTEAYYSFDYGNIHCVCLDSEGTNRGVSGLMLNWLRLDLAATRQAWTIAFWHHPPYTKGSHDSDDDLDSGARMGEMRRNALPILDSLGVDLVLTGHSHSYERSVLLKEHYGTSGTLAPAMIVNGGDGSPTGNGAYQKWSPGAAPREGAVYAVAGSSARADGGPLNHPVMVRSLNVGGSLILDVNANRLDAKFLSQTGAILDTFTILKGVGSGVGEPGAGDPGLVLAAPQPNPSRGTIHVAYEIGAAAPVRVQILDVTGRRVNNLELGPRPAGAHDFTWDGRDARGQRVVPGVYFIRFLAGAGERGTRVIVLK